MVPSAFTPRQAAPGLTGVFFQMLDCSKIALNGADIGSGRLAHLRLAVEAPSGTTLPTGRLAQYAFDFRTDQPAIAALLQARGITPRNVSIVTVHTPGPITMDLVQAKALEQGVAHTEFEFSVPKAFDDHTSKTRWFYGTNRDYLDIDLTEKKSQSDGAALVHITSSSPFFPVLEPATTAEGLASRFDARSEVWHV